MLEHDEGVLHSERAPPALQTLCARPQRVSTYSLSSWNMLSVGDPYISWSGQLFVRRNILFGSGTSMKVLFSEIIDSVSEEVAVYEFPVNEFPRHDIALLDRVHQHPTLKVHL